MLSNKKSTSKTKNMKTALALIFILGASFAGFTQDKNFDLSKYKFPDYKRHELEFNINAVGLNNMRTVVESTGRGDTNVVTGNSYFNSDITLNYKFDHLTRKRIDYVSSSLSGNYVYWMNQNFGETTKSYYPRINWVLDGSSKVYPNDDNFFMEMLTHVNYSFVETKNTYSAGSQTNTQTNLNYLNLQVGFGGGTGRMEKVSDLWQTYYILEKLKAQKSLTRNPEEKDIVELAAFVSKLKNKRFFDARLQKIAELTALDSVLHNQGLVEETDIAYFTTLNDYWSYGHFPDRESGKVLKFSMTPMYAMKTDKSNYYSTQYSGKVSLIADASFNFSKQLNLYWEQKLSAWISNETLVDTTGEDFSYFPNLFRTGASIGYGFYPNSRTSISGNLGYSGQNTSIYSARYNTPNEWINRVFLHFGVYYYISPQLQISGNFSMNYADKNYNETNPFYLTYNLGLRYAIF
jgi:hypothetical protein